MELIKNINKLVPELGGERNQVTYRISKAPKGKAKSFDVQVVLDQAQLKPDELLMIYRGKMCKLLLGKECSDISIAKVFPHGYIGCILNKVPAPGNVQAYFDEEKSVKLKLPLDFTLPLDMYVVARIYCQKEDKYELCRGLVVEDCGECVIIKLVDMFGCVEARKSDLFAVNAEYFNEPFRAFVAKLELEDDKLAFFSPEDIDKAVVKLVKENQNVPIKARFTATTLDATSLLLASSVKFHSSDKFLSDDVLDELIANAPGKFPSKEKETTKGCICHAEPNGDIFLQLESSTHVMQYINELLTHGVSNLKAVVSSKDQLENAQVYLAPFEGELFRAVIITKIDKKNVKVRYIDYGNCANVELSKLVPARACHIMLEKIPPLCFQIILKWVGTILDMDEFRNMWYINYDIQVRKEKINGIRTIVLSGKVEDQDTNINQYLVKNHLAKRRKCPEATNSRQL